MRPLAEILRPQTLDDYVGQNHLMSKDAILRKTIENGNVHSMILWGPPGTGKTSLATLISQTVGTTCFTLSAINSGVKEVREVIERAKLSSVRSILFIDEIHRFNKSQQDSLLGAVEKGIITLIGATTENPSFEVISPLLSRCQVYILKSFELQDIRVLIERAVAYFKNERNITVEIEEDEALIRISGGDARKLLNAIEIIVDYLADDKQLVRINNSNTQSIIQKKLAIYDKSGEQHYDIISAFIKSIRGSDPNAAVYWLARMIAGGEDPKFIARRMLILASEDIGNANPNALLLANNCFDAINKIGWPESRIILSQTAIYLASSAKSNSAYMAINNAQAEVSKSGDLPVPLHIRNAPTKLMKNIGYGENYKYAHNYESNFTEQEFLPDGITNRDFIAFGNNPKENELKQKLKNMWNNKYKY